MEDDKCELKNHLIASQSYVVMLCERLQTFHSQCCSESHYVAAIVLEHLMRKANELKHQIINLRDAMELEHNDDRDVQPVREESRDVQEEAAS